MPKTHRSPPLKKSPEKFTQKKNKNTMSRARSHRLAIALITPSQVHHQATKESGIKPHPHQTEPEIHASQKKNNQGGERIASSGTAGGRSPGEGRGAGRRQASCAG
jgi:hypothetical protein